MFNPNSSKDALQAASATPNVATSDGANAYVAPAIENVFSPADLQREVLYAAPGDLPPGPGVSTGGGTGTGGLPTE